MNRFLSRAASPTAILYTFVTLAHIASGMYLAQGIEPPSAFALTYAVGLLWLIGWWLLSDSRRRGVAWVFDMGFFLFLAWPIIMPYYLLKTRGARGVLVILGFITVYIGALAAGAILWISLKTTTG